MVNKKAQEEIVGFVLIVVIMAVILLIILGVSLRSDKNIQKESKEISQFLESTMEYTSDCAINYEPDYAKIGDLIEKCYSKAKCSSGKNTCDVLRETLNDILDSSWKVGPDRPIKGYLFNATYETNLTHENIVILSKGECKGSYKGAEYLSPAYPGTIVSSFNLCY